MKTIRIAKNIEINADYWGKKSQKEFVDAWKTRVKKEYLIDFYKSIKIPKVKTESIENSIEDSIENTID